MRFNLSHVKSGPIDSDSPAPAYSVSPLRVQEILSSIASPLSIHSSKVYVEHLRNISLLTALKSFA